MFFRQFCGAVKSGKNNLLDSSVSVSKYTGVGHCGLYKQRGLEELNNGNPNINIQAILFHHLVYIPYQVFRLIRLPEPLFHYRLRLTLGDQLCNKRTAVLLTNTKKSVISNH